MNKEVTMDNINLAKMTAEPYRYVGQTREEIVDTVIRYGVLDVNANLVQGSKEQIADAYTSHYTSQKAFGEFLCELYCHNRYSPVNLAFDDKTPYKPFNLLYNQAGVQFQFRDKNSTIHLECIAWSEVARRIGRMIRHKEYFSDAPLSELRKGRNKEIER